MKRIEVLAPAGNFACLQAAIQGGADSVFLGVGELNMRASSNTNFTVETLPEAVALCHKAGVKISPLTPLFITKSWRLYDKP